MKDAESVAAAILGTGGSLSHPLGTDPIRRELLTHMIYGGLVSLVGAMLALLMGSGLGAAFGLIAGYYGGRLDALVMRVADTTMAFPIILFAILFVMVLGGSLMTTRSPAGISAGTYTIIIRAISFGGSAARRRSG